MYSPPISIRRHNSEMHVVPAIHFCSTFASEVNRICSNPETRPEAIAVELGPIAAAAAFHWIQELKKKSGHSNRFPVMLALVKQNRMIRASLRDRAIRLQERTGSDIRELDPEILHRELGFKSHSILFLSPVDSIIEAIRCALELHVPVYGVDIEETASGIYEHGAIQDPRLSKEGMAAYTLANLPLADVTRDSEIDPRREVAMAARLKTLMQQHSKLLFTCGMAHWLKIERMLADDSLEPAPVAANNGQEAGQFKKIVVHPSIAVQYMDLFPTLVQSYEKSRIAASSIPMRWKGIINPEMIFRGHLKKSYKEYFANTSQATPLEGRTRDLESIPVFEAYLRGIQQLSHRAVPDIFMTLQAAQETMSSVFVDVLTGAFMKFPWARPGDYPGYSVLMQPPSSAREGDCAILADDDISSKQRVYLHSIPGFCPSSKGLRISYGWDVKNESASYSSRFTWRPWEYLISSMSFRATQAGRKKQHACKTVAFEGNLLEGIDIKSTLRAFSQGKEHLYVRDVVFEEAPKSTRPMDGFPVVWILDPGKHPGAQWKVLHEPSDYMKKHVRDRNAFQENVETRGDSMAAIVGYGHSQAVDRRAGDGESYSIDHYYGVLVFQPLCWTDRQFAHWVETTRYKRNPFYCREGLNLFSERSLKSWCEQKYGLRLEDHDWATSMTLMAMPFCIDSLTVVMPQKCRLEPIAYERAHQYGINLATLPLDMFSRRQISRLSTCQLVPAITIDPEIVYSKSIERAIGESQTTNRELVPPEWLNFGTGKGAYR